MASGMPAAATAASLVSARAMASSAVRLEATANGATTPRADAKKELLTLSEIDKLLTHIAREFHQKPRGIHG